MDIFAAFQTDTSLEVSGIWEPLADGVKVKVARNGTRAYSRAITAEVERYSLALEAKDEAADKVSEQIVIGVMAEYVLLDWSGFTENDEVVPYSKENAKRYLAVKDFRKKISQIADDMSKFKVKHDKATTANL